MQIDKTLILAAGKGTRMGEVGKKLPKVLWPIFEKSILELEIDYVRSFNNSKIFINSYHHKKQLAEYFEQKNLNRYASLIEEPSEIDIGGAIHNLCEKTGYDGNLLVVNSDQFLMLSEPIMKMALPQLENNDGILFVTTVNSSDGYNQVLKNKNNIFIEIKQNKNLPANQKIETYIGASIIKLDTLKPCAGSSKFFDAVANPINSKFVCINVDECTYWDFGTLKQYYDNMFKLLRVEDSFKEFLIDNHALIKSKITSNSSYNTTTSAAINLSTSENMIIEANSILIAGPGLKTQETKAIIFEEIIQSIT